MSDTRQDETPTQLGPTAGGNARPVPQREFTSESTPAKKKYGANLIFASEIKNFDKVRNELGSEMDHRWVGAMPIELFFKNFLPPPDAPLAALPEDPFKGVPKDGVESACYSKFIEAIEEWMPHLHAINTSNKEDTANRLKLKTDISFYNRIDGAAPPQRTDFSKMELWIEFKSKTQGVAFQDPPESEKARHLAIEEGSFTPNTVDGINTRGQLAHYAGAQHSVQFRHFSFSVLIEGDHARFLRWDPAGTIVTAAFDYRKSPKLMAEFLWRFDHLSAEERGHDESVQPSNLPPEEDARVRKKLGIKDNSVSLYRYTLRGLEGYAYGPRPPTQNRSLVSRCTRSLPVVWIPDVKANRETKSSTDSESSAEQDAHLEGKEGPWCEERIIYMKDTWRFLSNLLDVEVKPEHEIYEILHAHKTPNIPEHVAGGDVPGGKTRTQEFVGAKWLCVKLIISPFQHYRLFHGIVGHALSEFNCTKQLVTAVLNALQAHAHAFQDAKLLHRDISAGNIILTDEGRGLLIDWEMAKKVGQVGNRRPDRTGTWQFMSANLLKNPGKMHILADDLESFLHVLGWMTLRYVPAIDSYPDAQRGWDMAMFDEYLDIDGYWKKGGNSKSHTLGAGQYPSEMFRPRTRTPLFRLLQELSDPFKSLYRRPLKNDRDSDTDTNSNDDDDDDDADDIVANASLATRCYKTDMKRLQHPSWFINKMKRTLDKKVWPTDDKADETLSIARPSRETENQVRIRTSQLQNIHSTWAMSKGLPRSSKREASPTPETSSKRRRGTPAASESIS